MFASCFTLRSASQSVGNVRHHVQNDGHVSIKSRIIHLQLRCAFQSFAVCRWISALILRACRIVSGVGTRRNKRKTVVADGLRKPLRAARWKTDSGLERIFKRYSTGLGRRNRLLRQVQVEFYIMTFENIAINRVKYFRTTHLMEKVCQGVGPAVFYTCLWECLSSNAAVRLPAVLFILSHFDRHLTTKDQLFVMGNDSDILVSIAFS